MRKRYKFLGLCYFTGIAAGSLGIGGGMILGPFMLGMGMDAQMSTALSGFIVLFTSSSTSFQFTVAGAIHLRHAGMFMITSFIGSLMGNMILKKIVKHYKRPSILVWVVFTILVLASIVLPSQMVYNTITNPKNTFKIGELC